MATRLVIGVIALFISLTGLAQQRGSYDIASFISPQEWTKESAEFATSFVKTNNISGGWCRITLYKSLQSSGNPRGDFSSEWKVIVANNYKDAAEPEPESTVEEGWTANSGVSTFQWQAQKSYVLLSTISGYGKVMSIMVTMNNQEFMPVIEKFLDSITLEKPVTQGNTQIVQKPEQSSGQINIENVGGKSGISISTTNFDDGWVAQPFSDYVKATKGNASVLLHYGIEVTDEMRSSGSVERFLWNKLIEPRYQITNMLQYDNGGPCYFCIAFFEADAIDKQTGKKFYVGLRVLTENGISRCIELVAPSKSEFQQYFPDQEKIAAMTGYNKFAISMADIVGTWEESGGSAVNMYNTVTGSYAGMNTASSAHAFTFNSDGNYESHHSGAHGMVGAMQFFDQKYNGKNTITYWDMTLTNRFEGKTDVYWAQFEAVKGGRVLHLTDKAASGMQYHLVKTK